MVEFRNTLQTDCWEAGGHQLPSYITALTAFSADSGGKKRVLEARAGKNVNRNETKKKREREKQRDGKRGQRGLKNRSNWGWKKKRKEGDVRRKSRL